MTERNQLRKMPGDPESYPYSKLRLAEQFLAKQIAKGGVEAMTAANMAKARAQADETIARARAMAEKGARIVNGRAQYAAKIDKAKPQEAEEASEEIYQAQCEEELFATKFRRIWNMRFSRLGITFHETTSIPAMRYTYPDPDEDDYIDSLEALQIASVKVASIKDSLFWPLQVFGTIAVRDVLDHKCNIIFQRPRNNCQTIKEDVCNIFLSFWPEYLYIRSFSAMHI